MPEMNLDGIDLNILRALQGDARLTNVELASRVGLSPSPCLRRVKRLEEEGYLAGSRAVLRRERIGLGLTVFLDLKVRQDADMSAFYAQMAEMPEIIACHVVAGEYDFLLEVVVPDLAHYERLLVERFLRLPVVRDLRSHVVLRNIKADGPLPLAHLAEPECRP